MPDENKASAGGNGVAALMVTSHSPTSVEATIGPDTLHAVLQGSGGSKPAIEMVGTLALIPSAKPLKLKLAVHDAELRAKQGSGGSKENE